MDGLKDIAKRLIPASLIDPISLHSPLLSQYSGTLTLCLFQSFCIDGHSAWNALLLDLCTAASSLSLRSNLNGTSSRRKNAYHGNLHTCRIPAPVLPSMNAMRVGTVPVLFLPLSAVHSTMSCSKEVFSK